MSQQVNEAMENKLKAVAEEMEERWEQGEETQASPYRNVGTRLASPNPSRCNLFCYTFSMGTEYPRIAITRDPELNAALQMTMAVWGKKPVARLVRDLAIRGAATLASESGGDLLRRLAIEHGARLATGSTAEMLAKRGPLGKPDKQRRASKLLDQMRNERLP